MFVFASDLHLTEVTFAAQRQVLYEGVEAFRNLLHLCHRHDDCPLVLGGDIWDTKRISPELLRRVLEVRRRFPLVAICYINGNHDNTTPGWTSFLSNTFHLPEKGPLVSRDGLFAGVDWTSERDLVSKLDPLRDQEIPWIITHQYINMPGIPAVGINPELYAGFRKVLAGDIHKPLKHGNIEYCGSASRRSRAETRGQALVCRVGQPTIVTLPNREAFYLTLPDTDVYDFVSSLELHQLVPEEQYGELAFEPLIYLEPWLFVEGTKLDEQALFLLEKRLETLDFPHLTVPRRLPSEQTVEYGSMSGHSGMEYAVSVLRQTSGLSENLRDSCVELFQDPDSFQHRFTTGGAHET